MHVDEVELRVIRLPFKSVFKTSFAAETEKHAVIITVRSEGVEGYGESVMDTLPSYREESIVGALHLIREALAPSLLQQRLRRSVGARRLVEGLARQPDGKVSARARGVGLPCPATRCAAADAARRRAHRDPRRRQPRHEPGPETVASVARHVEQGYKRIKLKIEPGWDVNILLGGACGVPRHRADRRCQLGVHARRSRRAEADRSSSICTTSSSRCIGTTSSTTPRWRRSCRRRSASTSRSHRRPG